MKWKTFALSALATVCAGTFTGPAVAAPVDLASTPMITGLSKVVPPNVHFIMDDSGSMNDDFMPDGIEGNRARPCFRNFGYNKIFYNPATTYVPPVRADGTSFPAAVFTGAKDNGFAAAPSTTDLSVREDVVVRLGNNPFRTTNGSKVFTVTHANHGLTAGTTVTFTNTTNRANNIDLNNQTFTITSVVNASSYTVTSPRTANATGNVGGTSPPRVTFQMPRARYAEYVASPASPPGTCQADTTYTLKTPSTAAEKTNYANWHAYYRTRLLMMKTASGRAFADVDERYRVGLDRINNRNNSNVMVNIDQFDDAQRDTWYTRLYGMSADGYTPLRGALSKAGRLFAGKVVTGVNDPVQYSCQQNFSILTTDGYWNLQNEITGTAVTNYGPRREDNLTLVGDQDGGEIEPYKDAGAFQNTLADVAMYYYKTDLRPLAGLGGLIESTGERLDVSVNNVQGAAADTANWQHMTTFGLGLGVAGTLVYADNYATGGSPDYTAILQGTKNWPDPQVASAATELPARIDDLWHAAVNGRGKYLSASSPDKVVEELQKTLAAIAIRNASAAAAATSTLEPVAGDNFAYVAQYTTGQWFGDLQARDIDLVAGTLSLDPKWSARDLLSAKIEADDDARVIKTFDDGGGDKLKDFTVDELADEIAAGYFESDASNPNGALTQFVLWDVDQQAAATSEAMIAFLRGRFADEDEAASATRLFRDRSFALGDIVNTSPVFVKKPPFNYGDPGYSDFASDNSDRTPVVYVGANDGMLHAFDAETGVEKWAFVPSAVIPRMYKLADASYANNHEYFVDGPITVGDAYDGSEWKTILIGGLGRGGRAYYALDVTDPDSPKALWEFGTAEDADLGYSYGNPILTKRSSDGRWVVLFASGYNNTGPGDSRGRLYVVDAFTGARLQEIITDGAVVNPDVSGIAKINNFVPNSLLDNTSQYVYGGDLGGSLWRFDLTTGTSLRLGRTSATAGDQPITVRPELARVPDGAGGYYRVVYFATGRYLGFTDLSPLSPSSKVAQAVYAVKDSGLNVGVFADPVGGNLVEQTLDYDPDPTAVSPRSIPDPVPVDWATRNGWFMNTPVGERMNVDPRVQLGTLVVVSNVPKDDYCEVGGRSWMYTLDYRSGAAVVTSKDAVVGTSIGLSLATGLTLIRLPSDKLIALVTLADTTVKAMSVPVGPGAGAVLRRVGWKEIF